MKKILLATLLSVFLLSAIVVPSFSQTIGVAVDDVFSYVGRYSYESTSSDIMVPYQLADFEVWTEIKWINRTVTAIDGSNVTFENAINYYANDTVGTNTTVIDTSGTQHVLSIWVVDADADVGDEVGYDDTWLGGPVNITDIVQFSYAEETRDCKRHSTVTGAYATVNRTYLWDDTTGILVKQIISTNYESGADYAIGEYVLDLDRTNLWVVPELPTGAVMLAVFVAVTVSIAIYRRKS
jgi:hypothetical protein